jgi:heme-degrading monooxygenase HmoA
MMTIVTHVHLKEGTGNDWDGAMRKRLSAARSRPGWVGGQLLRPVDKPNGRVIVGTWRTRADWDAWHHDPRFADTRERLDGLESAPAEHWWHEVVLDVRKASPRSIRPAAPKRKTKGKESTARKRAGR